MQGKAVNAHTADRFPIAVSDSGGWKWNAHVISHEAYEFHKTSRIDHITKGLGKIEKA